MSLGYKRMVRQILNSPLLLCGYCPIIAKKGKVGQLLLLVNLELMVIEAFKSYE
jgi:hypothetical protein